MDTPLWVTLLVALLTAFGSYVAGIRPARIAARQAEADRDLARQERDDSREQWFIERIEKAWELCRSEDEKDKRAGVRMLRGHDQGTGADPGSSPTSSTRWLKKS